MQKVIIDYTRKGEKYTVTLTAQDIAVFEGLAKDKTVTAKKGEALVTALLDKGRGDIWIVERAKNGVPNDGPDCEPARQVFSRFGATLLKEHYKNGERHNGANGAPAVQTFDDEGKRLGAESYKDGERIQTLTKAEMAEMDKAARTKAFVQKSFGRGFRVG